MIKTLEHKLYLTKVQAQTLCHWLRVCCGIYNRALDQRIKAWKRRRESISYNTQQSLLTKQRARIEELRLIPAQFERDALRRVERGFKAFFRRIKAGQKPGFPRFRSWRRYVSLECSAVANYVKDGIRIPCLGVVRARGPVIPSNQQKMLRVIHRASGWYAQLVIDDGVVSPPRVRVVSAVGVDVGLMNFAALSNNEIVSNPRWLQRSASKIRSLQRRVSRRQKRSSNRRKAVASLTRRYERIALQRRNFC